MSTDSRLGGRNRGWVRTDEVSDMMTDMPSSLVDSADGRRWKGSEKGEPSSEAPATEEEPARASNTERSWDLDAVVPVPAAAAGDGLGYTHCVLRSLHERHVGRTSSHLTLRALQFLQPVRDFL